MTEQKSQGLPKHERIVSRKLIGELFTGGQRHSLTAFPLRVVYMPSDRQQVLFSVPKRYCRHAVDRNRVKRQLREAYRHNRHLLTTAMPEGRALAMAFVWITDKLMASATVEQRLVTLLKRVAGREGCKTEEKV